MRKFLASFIVGAAALFAAHASAGDKLKIDLSHSNNALILSKSGKIDNITAPFSVITPNSGNLVSQVKGHVFDSSWPFLTPQSANYRIDNSVVGVASLVENVRLREIFALGLKVELDLD